MSALFVVAAFSFLAAPGVRLLLLASRTRQAPELLCGLYFVGLAIGIPLRILGAQQFLADPGAGATLNGAGHVFFAIGTLAMASFVRRVFHPDATWALVLCVVVRAAIASSTAALFALDVVDVERSRWMLLANLCRLLPLCWAFVESFRYWRLMSRRAGLGLANAVVVNRFALWTIWTGALALIPALAAVGRIAGSYARASEVVGIDAVLERVLIDFLPATLALAAPVGCVALWLSFFPPALYLRRLGATA